LYILVSTKTILIICKITAFKFAFGTLYLEHVFTILQITVFTTSSAYFRNTVKCAFCFVALDNFTSCGFFSRSCFISEAKSSIFTFISATSITRLRAVQSHTFFIASFFWVVFYPCTGFISTIFIKLNTKYKETIHTSRYNRITVRYQKWQVAKENSKFHPVSVSKRVMFVQSDIR